MRISTWNAVAVAGLLLSAAAAHAQFEYITNNGTIEITGYDGAGGAVVIPAALNGLPVTSIGEGAFYFSSSLTSVVIPGSVAGIGNDAFEECYNLEAVTIGAGVASLGSDAFGYCSSLTNVAIPDSVTSLGESAFYSCSRLATVTIGGGVTSIGISAFQKCNALVSVTIGGAVTSVGSGAFANCIALASVYFQGNAPDADSTIFHFDMSPTTYYLPGTTGWSAGFGGFPTAPWTLPYPVILNASAGLSAGQFGFTISWATNLPVVVEACTNLAVPGWQPVQTNTFTGGTAYFSDLQWTNYPARYYRLGLP